MYFHGRKGLVFTLWKIHDYYSNDQWSRRYAMTRPGVPGAGQAFVVSNCSD